MAIAGVVIATIPDKTMQVMSQLNETKNVTTYGVYNDDQIVAVFESDSANGLEKLSKDIQDNIDGVIGIFPSYVTYEDEMDDLEEEIFHTDS